MSDEVSKTGRGQAASGEHIDQDASLQAPRIEFPCAYPIKIMGTASGTFVDEIVSICRNHAPEVQDKHVSVRPSSKGNYTAVTVQIEATGVDQLQLLFADLKSHPCVKMVL